MLLAVNCLPNFFIGIVYYVKRTPREVGVNLQKGYNGHLTSREAGSVGGQMVKKMIEAYERNMQ